MNKSNLLLLVSLVYVLLSCKNNDSATKIRPYDDLAKVDELLKGISQKPQIYSSSSDNSTKVIGENGTIIHVDPSQLETLDGTPIGETIEVELLEFTNKYSLITNSIQTLSDGEILVTGGAYYINMTSNGKQLKISEGKGINVEFPKLSDDEMSLFLGERDSLGQINWIPAQQKFSAKTFEYPQVPSEPEFEQVDTNSYGILVRRIFPNEDVYLPDSIISAPKEVKKEEVSEVDYQAYLKELELYNKKLQEIDNLKKTYQSIKILNFGWINCDRFYKNTNPKINIELTLNKDSILSARFFALFDNINSILVENYWENKIEKTQFSNIPVDMDIRIIGLTVQDSVPFWFSKNITTSSNQSIEVNFIETTQKQIEDNLKLYKE